MIPSEICNLVEKNFPDAVLDVKTEGVLDPFVKIDAKRIQAVSLFLRDQEELSFDSLMCLSGMDYGNERLGVVYHLHSMKWNHKITVKIEVDRANPHCQSVEPVWKTANWHEREAYDLFGIVFDGHPDLRRILLPDDWQGFPLRKDYTVAQYYHGMKVPY
jgi:NADH-quinone oxidoreductase subunit C